MKIVAPVKEFSVLTIFGETQEAGPVKSLVVLLALFLVLQKDVARGP
ncbi:MAG: hypothetical protein ACK5PS_06105 [Desulfopila sp.]